MEAKLGSPRFSTKPHCFVASPANTFHILLRNSEFASNPCRCNTCLKCCPNCIQLSLGQGKRDSVSTSFSLTFFRDWWLFPPNPFFESRCN
jgi:hypothetical protein